MVFLYHYTSSGNLQAILSSKVLRRNSDTFHAHYGHGVYLTSMTPSSGKSNILRNNYRNGKRVTNNPELAESYIRFDTTDLPGVREVTSCDRDVWIYEGDIQLTGIHYTTGSVKMVYLYHYTNSGHLQGILNDQVIHCTQANSYYAHHGQGVYFTSKGPEWGRAAILKNNYLDGYRGQGLNADADHYIRMKSEDLPGVRHVLSGDRDVWVYGIDIHLSGMDYTTGQTFN